jgi:hypothetical protein
LVSVQNWTSKALVLVSLASISLSGQTLNLKSGWNLKSANELIGKSSFDSTCVDIVWKYNLENGWSAYSSKADISTKISNSKYPIIGSMTNGDGFWVKTNQACDISTTTATNSVTSDLVSPGLPNETIQPQKDTSILSNGWNLKGATSVLDNTTFDKECIQVLWKYDPDNSWSGYSKNSTISNTITNKFTSISIDEGFWVKTTSSDCTLVPQITTTNDTQSSSSNDATTTTNTTSNLNLSDHNNGTTEEEKKSKEEQIIICMDQRVLDDILWTKYKYKREKNIEDYNICFGIVNKPAENSTTNSSNDTTTTNTNNNTNDTTNPDNTVDTTPQFIEYTINTGYIKNPIIWQDTNANLIKDPGEPIGIKVTDTSYKISIVDSSKNILLKGGTDSRDNKPFNSIMMTKTGIVDDNDNNNISVATSFFVVLKDSGTITSDAAIVTKVNEMVGDDYTKDPTTSANINKFEIKLYKAIESILPSDRTEEDIKKVYDDISITSSTKNINNSIAEYFGDGSDMIKTFLYDLMLIIDDTTLDTAGYTTINNKVSENITLHSKYPKIDTKQDIIGIVNSGLISGSTVFQDLNQNYTREMYEPMSISTQQGEYDMSIYDNTLDIPIISLGGTDKTYTNNSSFEGLMMTYPDIKFTNEQGSINNYITPLTTLVAYYKITAEDLSVQNSMVYVNKLIDDIDYRNIDDKDILKDPIIHGDNDNKLFNINISIQKNLEATSFTMQDYKDNMKKLLDNVEKFTSFKEILYRSYESILSDTSKSKLFTLNNLIHTTVAPTATEDIDYKDMNKLVYEIKNNIVENKESGNTPAEEIKIIDPIDVDMSECEALVTDTKMEILSSSSPINWSQSSVTIMKLKSLRDPDNNYNSISIIYEPLINDTNYDYEALYSKFDTYDAVVNNEIVTKDYGYKIYYSRMHSLKFYYLYNNIEADDFKICKKVQFPYFKVYKDPFDYPEESAPPEFN